MCATYYISLSDREIREIVDAVKHNYKNTPFVVGDIFPKYIAPVLWNENGNIKARPMYWGLPLKDKKAVNFNARSENLNRIGLYKDAKPMVIPTSGFYEWKTELSKKRKYIFNSQSCRLTYIAGIYIEYCIETEEEDIKNYPYCFTMLTRKPDAMFSAYHNREPVVLDYEECERWLLNNDKDFLFRPPLKLHARSV